MINSFEYILLIHLIATAFMTSLIWVIQMVHYPSFAYVEKKRFKEFEGFHSQRISIIVIPIMFLELISAIYLLFNSPKDQIVYLSINLLALFFIWATTFLVSSRIHNQLFKGYDSTKIKKLISTNWLRTWLWTGRFILVSLIFISSQSST